VTEETFAAWKAAFEAEQAAQRMALGEMTQEQAAGGKKTGKQWFLDKYGEGEMGTVDDEDEDLEDGTEYDFEQDDVLDSEGSDNEDEFLDQYLAGVDGN
jgi:hypothetical protein